MTAEEYIVKAYEEGKSTYVIAKELKTYPNRIRKILIECGVKLRDKSEAQKTALTSGRHEHPTKGKKQSEATKVKISETIAQQWKDMSEKEKERRSNIAKENWNKMSEDEKTEFRKLASEAVRESSEKGSKLERHLLVELVRRGYKCDFHRTQLVISEKLEMDILLPDLNTVIEIDGPAHFYPIWGEENLAKHITADNKKNGLLLSGGYVVIRIKHLVKSISEIHKRKVLTKVLTVLESIKNSFPEEGKRLIEIEVD